MKNPGCEQNQPPVSGHIHSHLVSPHPVPCSRPQFAPSTNKHVVSPLNLSTTIGGSLVGLRESLVTLSAALESQGRRLELAFTTEGLRVSEEVGSLKAIVQGLRMQVSLDISSVLSTFLRGPGFVIRVALYSFTLVPLILLVGLPYNLQGTIFGRRSLFIFHKIWIGLASLAILEFQWRGRVPPSRFITSYLYSFWTGYFLCVSCA